MSGVSEFKRDVQQERMEWQFTESFRDMQGDMFSTHSKNKFNAEDLLVNELETFMRTRVPVEAYERFASLFPAFRNARIGLKLMLSVGELGETLEAVRKNVGADPHCPQFSAEEVEVADAIIRLMNYATDRGLRLAEAVVAKNKFNRDRLDHSKESRESEHGKRF